MGKTVPKKQAAAGAKRHQRKSNISIVPGFAHITDPVIKRMSQRGGVKLLGKSCRDETRFVAQNFFDKVLDVAVISMRARNRRTVNQRDILFALKKVLNASYYG